MTDPGLLLARIVIEHRATGDGRHTTVALDDGDGGPPDLVTTLGLLAFARELVMCPDCDHDDDEDGEQ